MSQQVNYSAVSEQLERVALSCGRDPRSIRLVAVSKTVDAAAVEQAAACGAREFGENRPEMLAEKAAAFPQLSWHMIGNIQSRKIPQIVCHAALIHSVCDMGHVEKIGRAACELGKTQDILLEANVSGELSKSGFAPHQVLDAVLGAARVEGVRVCGLMTMAPRNDDQIARASFQGLAELQSSIQKKLACSAGSEAAEAFCELSMGMTEDWPLAVECGATIVRIGRAVFPPMDS